MKKVLILLTFIFLSANSFSQINFYKGSVADVMKAAQEQNKVVMVDVLTDWCKWCIELDNKVYSNNDVAAFANQYQINYKIDAEKGEGKDFAKKYSITGYPTILFINPDGTELDRIVGYIPVNDFLTTIKDFNKGINTFNYLKEQVSKDPENTETLYKLSNKYLALGNIDSAKIHLARIISIDPANVKGKTDDAKYLTAALSTKDVIISELSAFITQYPQSDVLKDAYVSLSENLYYVDKNADAADEKFKETIRLFPTDEWAKSSYGQFKNAYAGEFTDSGMTAENYQKGLTLIDEALPLVKGSVNEASSYYLQSKLLYNLKEYDKALVSIDNALKIFDRKLYRDQKEKVLQTANK